MTSPRNPVPDLEKAVRVDNHLQNSTAQSFSWEGVQVFPGSRTKDHKPAPIITNVDGIAMAGRQVQLA